MTRRAPRRRLPRLRRFLLRIRYRSIGALRDAQALQVRRHPVPDGPALFVYGHSFAADTAVPTPWSPFVADALGLPLVNRAMGGDVVRQTALRAGVGRGRPGRGDLVLVHTGLNDVMRHGRHPDLAGRYGATLRTIAGRLGRAGATVHVLADVTLLRWDHHPPMDEGSAAANAAVRAAALAVPGAIDLLPGWDPATMLLPDGIHPNEVGVANLTRVILEALRAEPGSGPRVGAGRFAALERRSRPKRSPTAVRIYLAWQYITGYSTAGMHVLAEQGHDVRLMYQEALVHPPYLAPFDDAELTKGLHATGWVGQPDEAVLRRELEEFQPEVIIVNSWHIAAYMKAARAWRGRALRVVVMDHQWLGTPKQWLGRLTRRFYIQPAFDAAFMPGDEQAVFACHLGFRQHELITGLYACEDAFFTGPQDPVKDRFLFVGRLVATKGVDVLAAAYRAYRATAADPWPLVVAGIGPMDGELGAMEGVELLGFVRPADLPAVMADAGCLVLPSRFEPWGVVLQEAAASGEAVICTSTCGAASRLVLDGYNGRVVAPDNPEKLTEAMHWVADADPEHRVLMSQRGVELAKQYTPRRWAEHLVDKLSELRPQLVSR